MKSKFLLTLLLSIPLFIFAQKQGTYKQTSEEIKKTVWDNPTSGFDLKTVPEKYNNESAVVLARSFDMQRISGSRFKFMIITATSIPRTNKTSTFRERVKINDKVALEKFSRLEYQKMLDKTQSYSFLTAKNTKEVFIGVKVIKPDGKEIIVNTDEEIVLANSNKDQTGKLAVPGLQVGDIIDYFISTIQVIEGDQQEDNNKYMFVLADEYPVLNYNYKFQYNKKVTVACTSLNGAPEFTTTTNDDKDQIYTLQGKDIPKFKREIWSSPLRELPYITISSIIEFKVAQFMTGQSGYDKKLSRLDNHINNLKLRFDTQRYPQDNTVQKRTEYHFKTSKIIKDTQLETSMAYFYNLWKFRTFCYYDSPDFYTRSSQNLLTANSRNNAVRISLMLNDMKIPHDIILVSPKFSSTLENVVEDDDFDALIRINDVKPIYMVFNKITTAFNELPAIYQGERAIVLTPEKKGHPYFTFARSETILPVIPASENSLSETLDISFMTGNLQQIKIHRIVKEKNSMKMNDQLNFLLSEDIDNYLREVVGGDDMKKRFSSWNASKKDLANYTAARELERKGLEDSFKSEINEQFDQDAKALIDFKILNNGLAEKDSPFEFETNFTMDNFVKKAGNNYLLDIGRLMGTISKIEEEERERKTNIYMPAARSFNYTITVNIPANYKAVGFKELVSNKINSAGSFAVDSKIDGQQLIVTVNRAYLKNYLPKEEWKDVLAILDEARLFSEKKILLEKTN